MKHQSKAIGVIIVCGGLMLLWAMVQPDNLNAQRERPYIGTKDTESKTEDVQREIQEQRNRGDNRRRNERNRSAARRESSRENTSASDEDFYRVVVDNNLFRPLGWRKPNREPQYVLVGTLIESDGEIAKAFVMEQRSNQYYFVSVGEKVGEAVVEKIGTHEISLNAEGKVVSVKVDSAQFLSGSGSGGGGREGPREANAGPPAPGGENNRGNTNRENRGGEGANFQGMQEQFRNASPEERRRMMEQFRRNRGQRGGGGNRGGDRGGARNRRR